MSTTILSFDELKRREAEFIADPQMQEMLAIIEETSSVYGQRLRVLVRQSLSLAYQAGYSLAFEGDRK